MLPDLPTTIRFASPASNPDAKQFIEWLKASDPVFDISRFADVAVPCLTICNSPEISPPVTSITLLLWCVTIPFGLLVTFEIDHPSLISKE